MAIRVILKTARDEAEWGWLLENVPMSRLLAIEKSLGNRKPYVSNFVRASGVSIPLHVSQTTTPAASSAAAKDAEALFDKFLNSFGSKR